MELIFPVKTKRNFTSFWKIFFYKIGSPFVCNVYSSEFIFENYEYVPIHKRTSFSIKPKLNSVFNPNLHVDIITPSGKQIKGKIEKISINLYTIDFIPNEIGDHEIRFYNDEEKKLIMTKFICQVYDINQIRVSDLPIAVAHRLYKFTSKKKCFFFCLKNFSLFFGIYK